MVPVITEKKKKEMFAKAVLKSGMDIRPVRNMKDVLVDEAFVSFNAADGRVFVVFWYNTPDNSTHTIMERMN